MDSEIKIVNGGIFVDERGKITHCNDLDMDAVQRFYVIHHPDDSVIRAWHGHKHERKWFYVIKGSWRLALVKVDDWEHPSDDLQPDIFELSDRESRVVCVPAGYANGLKALEPDSVVIVFSDKVLSEAVKDSWRYDKDKWGAFKDLI